MEQDFIDGVLDCVKSVDAAWDRFTQARTVIDQAYALTALNDAIFDLSTWHPEFDSERGEIPPDGD